MSLYLALFGSPRMERSGVAVRSRATQKRRLAVLVAIAASPARAISRDRVVGLLWPDADAASARKSLSEALYVIRQEFGEALIETPGDELVLSESQLDCDLWRFRAALKRGDHREAVAAYAGPLLDGWFLDQADEFERWCSGQRDEAAKAYERALMVLAQEAEKATDWRSAAEHWERLTQVDALSARYVLGLAQALVSAGEVPLALNALAAHEAAVRRDLGVGPNPEVEQLGSRLRGLHVKPREQVPVEHPPTYDARVIEPPPVAVAVPARHGLRIARGTWLLTAAAAIVLLATGVAIATSDEPPPHRQRLAVLYLEDTSVERDLDGLASALTEALIDQLAGVPAFDVLSEDVVRPYRGKHFSQDSIARALKATYLIRGTVYRIEGAPGEQERIRVRIRLVDPATGRTVTSQDIERSRTRLLELREALAQEAAWLIRRGIGSEVHPREVRVGSSNSRAWILVSRGKQQQDEAMTFLQSVVAADRASVLPAFRRADSLYAQAEAEDPRWFRPPVERAWTARAVAMMYEGAARVSLLDSAMNRLAPVLREHPSEPAVLEVAGVLRWTRARALPPPLDSTEALRAITDLEAAIAGDSTKARSFATLASIYLTLNDAPRAELAARRGLALDTYLDNDPVISRVIFSASILRSQLDTARAWCDKGRLRYPREFTWTECALTVMKYDVSGKPDTSRAFQLVAQLDSLDPPALARGAGHAYSPIYRRMIAAAVAARAGNHTYARTELARAYAEVRGDANLELDLAPEEITLLLLFGDRARAQDRLEYAISKRPYLAGYAAQDPILKELRAAVPLP